MPDWSPDGTRVVFARAVGNAHVIYTVAATGGDETRVTSGDYFDSEPSWSPDGSIIAFWSERAGQIDIYVVRPDGTGEARITTNPAPDYSPNWRPAPGG